jgi:hypothetical protein
MQEQKGDTIHYRFEQWCDGVSEKTSNCRELYNLVSRLEELVEDGTLEGCEVFIFTDNTTAEAAFYKGNSSRECLYKLVLQLRKLRMKGRLKLHVIHCAGTRMQAEGADGASRGDLSTGAMNGTSVLSNVPLHKGALGLEAGLKPWLNKIWDEERGPLGYLSPEDWYKHGPVPPNCVWMPAPAAVDVAGKQTAKKIHQQPDSLTTHICGSKVDDGAIAEKSRTTQRFQDGNRGRQ